MRIPGSCLVTLLLFAVLVSAFLAGCTAAPPGTTTPPQTPAVLPQKNATIRIGAIYNLDGSEATFDVPSSRGAKLAVKDLNERGGIGGIPIDLVLVNGGSDVDRVVAGARELADSGSIPVIIGLSNPDHALPAGQAAASRHVYFVTSGSTSPRLPLQVPEYVYLACMGDNTQAAVGAEYAAGTLGVDNVYVLYQSDRQYPVLLAGYFMTRFRELDGTVQKVDTFLSKDTDYSSQVANLTALSPVPGMVYLPAETWADARPVIEAIRDAGFAGPIMGGDGYDAPVLLTGGATGVDRVYFTTHTWFDPANERQKEFMERYAREYNTTAVPFSGLGYDAVMIVAKALSDPAAPHSFPDGMKGIALYQGVTGNVSYSDGSHIPDKTVTVMEIRNGITVYIGNFMPVREVPA